MEQHAKCVNSDTTYFTRRQRAIDDYLREHPTDRYGLDILAGNAFLSGIDLADKSDRAKERHRKIRIAVVQHVRLHGGHLRQHARTGHLCIDWRLVPDYANYTTYHPFGECWIY